MSWWRSERGSATVISIALLPLLLTVVAMVLELGALRVWASRARSAADLAALVAVNDQDDAELARTGRLRLDAGAADVARAYFASNLAGLGAVLAADPDAVAGAAEITVLRDLESAVAAGQRYARPTVRIVAQVPVRTPLLGALLARPITSIAVRVASAAR